MAAPQDREQGRTERHSETTPWRRVKLVATGSALVILVLGEILCLARLVTCEEETIAVLEVTFSKPWMMGTLSGDWVEPRAPYGH